MEKCRHNFLCGTQGYFCVKCGHVRSRKSHTIIPIENTTDTIEGKGKNTHNKREFLKAVITGLGITLSIGLLMIVALLLQKN